MAASGRWRSPAAHGPSLLRRVRGRPEHRTGAFLIGHSLGIADQLHLQTPRRQEIENRLSGRWTFVDRNRPLHRRDVLGLEIGGCLVDVVDIKRNLVPAGWRFFWT